jgi:hypothetical protein
MFGAFTHADAGQMHLYLNYARKNWTHEGENPPVGLILCAEKDEAVARYALEGLPQRWAEGRVLLLPLGTDGGRPILKALKQILGLGGSLQIMFTHRCGNW